MASNEPIEPTITRALLGDSIEGSHASMVSQWTQFFFLPICFKTFMFNVENFFFQKAAGEKVE